MAISKTTYKINLPLIGIKNKKEVRDEVGQYLVEKVLSDVDKSKSSVSGKAFKPLSSNYKNYKKTVSSSVRPNMELNGDMLDALKFKVNRSEIEFGIFDKAQAQKSDNHNKFSAASKTTKVPQRQFIPKKGQIFRSEIENEIKEIIKETAVYSDDSDFGKRNALDYLKSVMLKRK